MAPRQNLPLVLDYGDGRPIRAVTRTLDRSGVSYYVDAEMPVRAPGAAWSVPPRSRSCQSPQTGTGRHKRKGA